jgi:hypothetical protein
MDTEPYHGFDAKQEKLLAQFAMMAADALQLQDKTTCRQACYRDEIGLF